MSRGFFKGNKQYNLVVHHLMGTDAYPDLVYNISNGLILCKDIHENFHKLYGYRKVTITMFQDFLFGLLYLASFTPISSQANSGGLEGSETRVYDPERIMELHERLSKIPF